MTKHKKYDLIKNLLELRELKEFRDIFKYLPKTAVAKDLGKEKGRFSKLIEDPDGFTLQELMKFGKNCNISLSDIGQLIETQDPVMPPSDPSKTKPYRAIGLMIKNEEIKLLEKIFDYIAVYEVAEDLGRKPDTLSRFIKHAEDFQVKDLRTMASLSDLTLVAMFKLVETQYAAQMQKTPR